MDRYWHNEHIPNNLTLLGSKFFSYKSCPKNTVNRKNISVSGNGKHHHKIKNTLHTHKITHSRNNSQLRKNKSKCQTQINIPVNKRKREGTNLSKETIRKKNSSDLSDKKYKCAKSSLIKIEDSKTVKQKSKKVRSTNEIFHSTSYSRHLDQDIEQLNENLLVSSEMIYVKDYDEEREKDRFRDMLVRTNRTLSFYKNKCSTLESSCAYYKNELIKAVRKLQKVKKSSKTKYKEFKKQTPKKDFGFTVI